MYLDSDRLNRWLTLAANFGVLIGIIFLVVEVRQNNTALNAQAWQSRSDALREMSMFVAGSDVLSTIEANLLVRPASCGEFDRNCRIINDEYLASLSITERQQFKRYLHAHLSRVQNLVFQYEQGLLTDEYHDDVILWVIQSYMPLWERFDIFQRKGLLDHLRENGIEQE